MPNAEYICRKASRLDPVEKIARYIYLTDDYIYPSVCRDPADAQWVDFIGQCMQTEGNLFHVNNLSVIEYDRNIVGIACVIPCGRQLDILQDIQLSRAFRDQLRLALDGYFMPLIKESAEYTGYNITNVCIDPALQGKGLGKQLLAHCLKTYGKEILHLDVIAANEPALRLYQRFGFVITDAYLGFSGTNSDLPCYHMQHTPTAE